MSYFHIIFIHYSTFCQRRFGRLEARVAELNRMVCMLILSLGLQNNSPTHPTHPDVHLPQSNHETSPDQLLPPSPGVRPGEESSSFSDNFELMVDKGGPYHDAIIRSSPSQASYLSYLSTPPIDQICSGLPPLAPYKSLNGAITEGAFASETWVKFVALSDSN